MSTDQLVELKILQIMQIYEQPVQSPDDQDQSSLEASQSKAILSILLSLINDHFLSSTGEFRTGATDLILELLLLLVENRPDVYFTDGQPLVLGFLFRVFPLLSMPLSAPLLHTVAKLIGAFLLVLCDQDTSPFLILFQDFQLLLSDLERFYTPAAPGPLASPVPASPAPQPVLPQPSLVILAFESMRQRGRSIAALTDLFPHFFSTPPLDQLPPATSPSPFRYAVPSLASAGTLFTNAMRVMLHLIDVAGLFLESEIAGFFSSCLERIHACPIEIKLVTLEALEKCLQMFPAHATRQHLSLYLCSILGLAEEVTDPVKLACFRPVAFDDAMAHIIDLLVADERLQHDFLSLSFNWLHLIEVNLLRAISKKLSSSLLATIPLLLRRFPHQPRLFEVSSQLLVTLLREKPPGLFAGPTYRLIAGILLQLCHHYLAAHAALPQLTDDPADDSLPLLNSDESFEQCLDVLFNLLSELDFTLPLLSIVPFSCLAMLFPCFYLTRRTGKYESSLLYTKLQDAMRALLAAPAHHPAPSGDWYFEAYEQTLFLLQILAGDPHTHLLEADHPDFAPTLAALVAQPLTACHPPSFVHPHPPLFAQAIALSASLLRFAPASSNPLRDPRFDDPAFLTPRLTQPLFLAAFPEMVMYRGAALLDLALPLLQQHLQSRPTPALFACLGKLLCLVRGAAHVFSCCSSADVCPHDHPLLGHHHVPTVLCTVCDASRLDRSPNTARHFRLSFPRPDRADGTYKSSLKRSHRGTDDDPPHDHPAATDDYRPFTPAHYELLMKALLGHPFQGPDADLAPFLATLDRCLQHLDPHAWHERSADVFQRYSLPCLTHAQREVRELAARLILSHAHRLLSGMSMDISRVFDAMEALLVPHQQQDDALIAVLTALSRVAEAIALVFVEIEHNPQPIDSFQYHLHLAKQLERTLLRLLEGLIQPASAHLKATCYHLLDMLSHKRFPTLQQQQPPIQMLIRLFGDTLYPFLIKSLIDLPDLFHDVVLLIDHQSIPRFLEKALPVALPMLLLEDDQITLKKLDQYLDTSLFQVVFDNLQYILSHILLHDPPDYLPDSVVMHNLQRLIKNSSVLLFRSFHTHILFLLVSKLSTDPDRARRALDRLHAILSRRADPPTAELGAPSASLSVAHPPRSALGTNGSFVVTMAQTTTNDAFSTTVSSSSTSTSTSTTLDEESRKYGANLSEYLSNNFLGLMGDITTRIEEASSTCIMQQASLLRSLSLLFEMVGNVIHIHRPKISSTLNNMLRHPGPLQSLALDAWFAFIKQLQPHELGPILPQIVADLLFYFNHDATKDSLLHSHTQSLNVGATDLLSTRILAILQYLFVDQRASLTPYYPSVPFLPSWPLFDSITSWQSDEPFDLPEQIDRLLGCLARYLNNNIREWTLKKLQALLSQHRPAINALAQASHPIITKLIRGLLNCSSYSHNTPATRFLSAACFGVLGAIDPVFIDERILPSSMHPLRKTTEAMLIELIRDFLVPSLHGLERLEQDRSALAIQELLKAADCTPQTPLEVEKLAMQRQALLSKQATASSQSASPSGRGRRVTRATSGAANQPTLEALMSLDPLPVKVWTAFPPEIQLTILPYLSSHYHCHPSTITPRFPICPRVHDYPKWLGEWTHWLIQQATGGKSKVFQACRSVVKNNTQVSMYLLPYLVLNVLKNGTESDCDHIQTEIFAVLDDQKSTPRSPSRTTVSFLHNCRQAIFTLIDFLISWIDAREKQRLHDENLRTTSTNLATVALSRTTRSARPHDLSTATTAAAHPNGGQKMLSDKIKRVKELIDQVPPLIIARASHNCKADGRALLHFERYLRSFPVDERHGRLIAERTLYLDIYNSLDEPDGLSGIATLASDMSSTQAQLFAHENAGRWSEALAYYNGLLVEHPQSMNHQLGLLRCLKNLGQLESLVRLLRGLDQRIHTNDPHRRPNSALTQSFQQFGAFAAWRLGDPMLLAEFLADPHQPTHNFEIGLAQIFRGIAAGEQHLAQRINYWRELLMRSLSASSMESYIRSYPFIAKLHMLQEIEEGVSLCLDQGSDGLNATTFASLQWEERLANVQQLYKFREPILSCQIALLRLGGERFEGDIGVRYLNIAKVARKEGLFQTAFSAVIQASHSKLSEIKFKAQIELVKLERLREERDQALRVVREIIQHHAADGPCLKMGLPFLIHGQLLAETGYSSSEEVIQQFETAIQHRPGWEKGFFTLGLFYDRLMAAAKSAGDAPALPLGRFDVLPKKSHEFLTPVIHNYGEALKYGHGHIYQSMPRMLTLWFECNAPEYLNSNNGTALPTSELECRTRAIDTANQEMSQLARQLPPQLWLACLSQLISRICHPNGLVWGLLKDILRTVLKAYPGQALWSLIAVLNSSSADRKKRAEEILSQCQTNATIKNTIAVAQQLTKLAMYITTESTRLKRKKHSLTSLGFRNLCEMEVSGIVLPLESQLRPNFSAAGTQAVFPSPITLSRVKDECELMSSQVAPGKIVFQGSDGRDYWFLCKPKDDLRKDARMMEFNHLINHLLKKNPESRRRKLHIRTYAVIPLDEANGLIEWVPNTSCFRHILNQLPSHRPDENARARAVWSNSKLQPSERFRQACAEVPPKFYKWFIQNFPQHNQWFASRLEYARTAAVISMVGTIVGLGDRHTENLLFSVDDGAIVSIDLNCLFWKGWQFKDPERVPFRLTPQMVDALGPTGCEGVFRRVCEITLGVIRNNRETLMTVLETFLYDPLVEWKDTGRTRGAQHRTDRLPNLSRGESPNPEVKAILTKVDKIISGEYGAYFPLSIEGQVDKLIKEATDPKNLGVMYLGWAAWL